MTASSSSWWSVAAGDATASCWHRSDVVTTEAAIRDRAAAHGVRTRSGRRAVSRLLTTCVVAAALATLAVLLLSAAHVIHF